jgi:hypothetical protein
MRFFYVVPENMITVPACATCNGAGYSDEEYMRTTTAGLGYAHSEAARIVWDEAVKMRGLFHKLRQAMKPGVYVNVMSGDEQDRVPETYRE